MILARDIYTSLGYAKWENFAGVIHRVKQLIANGFATGSIEKCEKQITMGKGAKRNIVDYKMDYHAFETLKLLTASYKINGHHIARNEIAILGMVMKWCKIRGISAVAQHAESNFFLDLLVNGTIAIEFDEPHHSGAQRCKEDKLRDDYLKKSNIEVFRFGLDSDVIDIITCIENTLAKH